jgi:CheY-like chemotaxis protein
LNTPTSVTVPAISNRTSSHSRSDFSFTRLHDTRWGIIGAAEARRMHRPICGGHVYVEALNFFSSSDMPSEPQPSTSSMSITRKPETSDLVLVVDDDLDLLDVTRFALESEGFTVATAENGEEALAMLRDGCRPNLVLLDLMMPVMNGWGFLDEVAREPAFAAIPIVVFTAAEYVDVPAGAVALARKPIALQSLIALIERHSRGVDEAHR